MLVRRAGEAEKDRGANEAFKEFGGRAEEGNRAVRGGEVGGFSRFGDGEDKGMLPDSREVSGVEGKIKKGGEEG